jgi:hypothetical protein
VEPSQGGRCRTNAHVAVRARGVSCSGGCWDAAAGRATGIGLEAYDIEGVARFHLFEGQSVWVGQVYGGHACVGISGGNELRVVDLATGTAVATRQQKLPWLLLGDGGGWWGV